MLCLIAQHDTATAKDVFDQMSQPSQNAPTSRYLQYKIALKDQDTALGVLYHVFRTKVMLTPMKPLNASKQSAKLHQRTQPFSTLVRSKRNALATNDKR